MLTPGPVMISNHHQVCMTFSDGLGTHYILVYIYRRTTSLKHTLNFVNHTTTQCYQDHRAATPLEFVLMLSRVLFRLLSSIPLSGERARRGGGGRAPYRARLGTLYYSHTMSQLQLYHSIFTDESRHRGGFILFMQKT